MKGKLWAHPVRLVALAATGLLLPLVVLFLIGYLPICFRYGGMSEQERAVQAYLAAADLQQYFDCGPLFGEPGPTMFGEWVRHDGDHYLIDWWGERTDYFMEDDGRRVVGPTPLPGATRVVCIGESSEFGFGLPDEQVHASYLQSELGEEFAVVNLAWPGLDVENYLQEGDRVLVHKPDILVVAISHNSMRNTLWASRCHGIEPAPVLSYPPLHPHVLREVWAELRNWSKQVVLRQPLVDLDLVGPKIYGRKMRQLVVKARQAGMEVILVRHDLFLKQPREIRGFKLWEEFGTVLASLAQEEQVPLLLFADLYGEMKPDEQAPAGDSLNRLRESGYSEEVLCDTFKEEAAFVDLIHPSAAANRALAIRLSALIRERTGDPKATER